MYVQRIHFTRIISHFVSILREFYENNFYDEFLTRVDRKGLISFQFLSLLHQTEKNDMTDQLHLITCDVSPVSSAPFL